MTSATNVASPLAFVPLDVASTEYTASIALLVKMAAAYDARSAIVRELDECGRYFSSRPR